MRKALRGEGLSFGTKEVCQRVGISARQLEYWVLKGIVKPESEIHGAKEFKKYSPEHIDFLERVKGYLDEGYILKKAIEKVNKELIDIKKEPKECPA